MSDTYSINIIDEEVLTVNLEDNGLDGWSPVLTVQSDGARRVLQVTDWQGGEGSKPDTGDYVGVNGPESDIADGVDIRGAAGADGASSYTYVAYASDDQGTGFSLTPSDSLDYIAVLSTDSEIPSPSAGDFTGLWVKYQSNNGIDDINAQTEKTDLDATDSFAIQETGGANKRVELPNINKDIEAHSKSPLSILIPNLFDSSEIHMYGDPSSPSTGQTPSAGYGNTTYRYDFTQTGGNVAEIGVKVQFKTGIGSTTFDHKVVFAVDSDNYIEIQFSYRRVKYIEIVSGVSTELAEVSYETIRAITDTVSIYNGVASDNEFIINSSLRGQPITSSEFTNIDITQITSVGFSSDIKYVLVYGNRITSL